ncbi:MAG: N-acetyltransferase [Mesorhizobium sp.]
MSTLSIRAATQADRAAIRVVEERAFGQKGEADLVDAIVSDGDTVLELVAEIDGSVVGHILFSRLIVDQDGRTSNAVSLAPLAVDPDFQSSGIGSALVREAHVRLKAAGELLSVVLGEPDYYGRFHYSHERAAGFASVFQCEALQALSWGDAPEKGRLIYAPAFGPEAR